MKIYIPQFRIATLEAPQTNFQSKLGGLPWGLPIEYWRRCQCCGRLMSLLAQLRHDPPALDLGGDDYVLHLFQCQECFGFDSGEGNDAVMVPIKSLRAELTQLPPNEDLHGVLGPKLDQMVGELWITGWREEDNGLDAALCAGIYDSEKWMQLPASVTNSVFENRWRTKMGGVPYWTGNGPSHTPLPGYEFLFQLDSPEFKEAPPNADEVGCVLLFTQVTGEGINLRLARQDRVEPLESNRKLNAPWYIEVSSPERNNFIAEITNLGTDGTAYVFINRSTSPAGVYWFWRR